MSDISTAYDAFVTRIEALLPDHLRLANPYEVNENSELVLAQGWGIAIGAGENSNRSFSCNLSVRRDIIVVITRRLFSTDIHPTLRADTEKLLFEDQKLIIADVESDPTLGNSSVVTKADYVSDKGLEIVFGMDKDNFLKIESTFSIEYFEDLN